ncbi:RNA polymerase sigma factor [Streptomyces lushanensis]|uniref:RNA polymerase sigma factor n=1 Tax=Streptomyces lushanensis TaxID=1434255 RepID=UPI000833ADE9|nr:sigma factor-like helix-turn-helix DNA-binding protein [Streptomyces lushanensis]
MYGPENMAGTADTTELLNRGAQGARAAFTELAGRHRARLLGLCRLITCDEEAARAAATAALRDVWRRLADGGGTDGRALPAAHALFDRRAVIHSLTLAPAPASRTADPDAADPGAGAFESGLRRLPPRQRAMLALSDFAGLSYDEIADLMDEPPGRVRQEVGKARRDLLRPVPAMR